MIIIPLCTYLYSFLWKRKHLEAWVYLIVIICSFVWEALNHWFILFDIWVFLLFEVQHMQQMDLSEIILKGNGKLHSLRSKCQNSIYNNVLWSDDIWFFQVCRIILFTVFDAIYKLGNIYLFMVGEKVPCIKQLLHCICFILFQKLS